MAATEKIKYTPNATDNAFLQTMRASEPTPRTESKAPATTDTGSKAANVEKKTLFNIKVNNSTLKEWKQFCLDYDLTLTAAIKRAMSRFIKDIKNGNADL